ncbi:FtsW/RodA/SpoVE family cell cycle protein [Butyrivibrio sp. XB500-5]|uniref:FtsW/RodA/SpoVE family cell cycle protein n=1 Tax=Butyrivibrio sp. XB500-5 TaxID=2364880 RepID=UPI000EA9B471|nr:FtsW/RodA/SpoVE family cell cycle protein [Butyrivibrio sp. XB500-5]RKM62741.1 FtsW/RodA/SpoVE family cell cycle protein [Butyrivibrio sp. XB500-5]
MELYVTEISKYVIAIMLLLYTVTAFMAFRLRSREARTKIYVAQIMLIFMIQIACFIQIIARTGKVLYLFFFAFQIVVFSAVLMLFYFIYPDGNRLIINNCCLLLMIGVVILTRLSYEKAVKQFVIVAISFLIGFFIPEMIFRFNFLKRFTWIYAAVGIAAIGAVLVLGVAINGSKLNYSIMGIAFQPSEVVKVLFLFFMAGALYKAEGIVDILIASAVAAVHVIILVLSKDLGSALIFFMLYLALIYISTENIGLFIMGLAFVTFASAVSYRLFAHIRVRVHAWLDPFSDITNTGYQLSQSLFGISSGGMFGLGLYGGSPKTIPFVESDFIFSAIAEEMGILFSILMVLVCLSTFLLIMQEGYYIHDKFYRMIICGIGISYIFQTFLTIGGGCKFIPLTGVTLPLLSYGGSSVLVTIVMIMIVEGICMIGSDERYEEYLEERRYYERKRNRYERYEDEEY